MESPTTGTKASSDISMDHSESTNKGQSEEKSFIIRKYQDESPELTSVTKAISKANIPRKNYCYVPEDVRLELLDAVNNKKEKIKRVAQRLGVNYSSAKSICQVFRKEGRISRIDHKDKRNLNDQSQPKSTTGAPPKSIFELNALTNESLQGSLSADIRDLKAVSISEQYLANPQNMPFYYVLQPVQVPEGSFVRKQESNEVNVPSYLTAPSCVLFTSNQHGNNSHLANLASTNVNLQSQQLIPQERQAISFISPSSPMPGGVFSVPQLFNPPSYAAPKIQNLVYSVNTNSNARQLQAVQISNFIFPNSSSNSQIVHIMKPTLPFLGNQQYKSLENQSQLILFVPQKVQGQGNVLF